MVAAVRTTGTPVWFLTAEDEGHSFTKASNREYLNQATLAFVRSVLADSLRQTRPGVKSPDADGAQDFSNEGL